MTTTPSASRLIARSCASSAWVFALGAFALFTGLQRPAHGTVTEPNGLVVPVMSGATEISQAASQNPLAPLITLDALFKSRSEGLDWQKDAKNKPDVFSPVCGFSAELILRGGGCQIDFGWYNVVAGHVPTDAEIYPVITAAQIAALPAVAFVPGVGQHGPMFSGADILKNANYKGGQIGFATKGKVGTDCTQTHYTQRDNNVLCTAGCGKSGDGDDHWTMAVIYKSTVDSNGYYVGFEDLPSSATDFSPAGGKYKNDGDMNDFVFYISGITCPGGGKHCSTGMPGVCAEGINECQTGGALACKPSVAASAEKCDGLDNDCNGEVDEGDHICPGTFKCIHGQCLGACGTSEFPCSATQVCDDSTGFCVDPACLGVSCEQGKVCVNGDCKGPCDGVTCPSGQECRVGRCADPCDGITCAADRVCKDGACIARCECLACDDGFSCQSSTGKCVEKGCDTVTCKAGEICKAGACSDACSGALCPFGQECKAGKCIDSMSPAGTGGKSGTFTGGVSGGDTGGSGTGTGGGTASGGSGSGTGGMTGSGTGGEGKVELSGCHCALGRSELSVGTVGWTLLAGVGLLVARRRRGR